MHFLHLRKKIKGQIITKINVLRIHCLSSKFLSVVAFVHCTFLAISANIMND